MGWKGGAIFGKLTCMDKDLKNKTLEELEQIVAELGQKKYIAKYIFSFIHSRGVNDIQQFTPLSKEFRGRLIEDGFYVSQLKVVREAADPDGTIKYVFQLPDDNYIESVLLFDGKRRTLCVSTQAGCAMNCLFCATGKLKFRRNLTAAEIVDQVNAVAHAPINRGEVSNIVYMGMGEPLNNYDNVIRSLRILNHPAGKNFGLRHLTVSTCGIAPAIERLADEDIQPRLAISLNAPADSIRTKLMPINAKYPLPELLRAVRVYQAKTRLARRGGLRVTFEYVLIKGVNDTVLHARMLIKRLMGLKCNVNLIEYNPHGGCKFVGSSEEAIRRFAKVLEQGGIETTVRLRMGRQIKAACGQLGADWVNGLPAKKL